MDGNDINTGGKCPVMHAQATLGVNSNRDWWPNQLNLKILHQQSDLSNPMDEAFSYREAFKKLDYDALKKDLTALMDGQPGLVACRLWALWWAFHPHGLAQRGHLSHQRRARRWRNGHATVCPAQQLA